MNCIPDCIPVKAPSSVHSTWVLSFVIKKKKSPKKIAYSFFHLISLPGIFIHSGDLQGMVGV